MLHEDYAVDLAGRVMTTQDYEYQSWATSINSTPEKVRLAVQKVGHSADAVREYLSKVHQVDAVARRSVSDLLR